MGSSTVSTVLRGILTQIEIEIPQSIFHNRLSHKKTLSIERWFIWKGPRFWFSQFCASSVTKCKDMDTWRPLVPGITLLTPPKRAPGHPLPACRRLSRALIAWTRKKHTRFAAKLEPWIMMIGMILKGFQCRGRPKAFMKPVIYSRLRVI